MKRSVNHFLFRRLGGGIFLLLLLLIGNREAAAQNYLLRYVNTTAGAVTFTGNSLGLAKANGQNLPGALDSIGAFMTLNTASQVGTYPPGTTLNWTNNSSAAVLQIPTNSTILYAELVWAGTARIGASVATAGNVLANVNRPVRFTLPNGATNNITPDVTTASFVTNGIESIFYIRSADVTALVQGAGAGTYSVGGVPSTIIGTENANNACGWTLAVVYENSSLHQRNLSLFVGNSFAISTGNPPPPAGVSGFCSPPTGPVNARLYVSAMEGDPNKAGDQMKFGPTTNSLAVLSGPNNLSSNFFAGQINGDNGLINTNGTFGTSNSTTSAVTFSARQGWDITSVDASSALTNGISSAFAQNVTAGDGYTVNALALQIDVGSPVLTTTQSVDKASTYIGDTLTYTVVVTNSGTADAVNLIFTDPLAFGTSFIPNTFTTNGVTISGANPVNGVFIPLIKQNGSFTVTYQVLVNQVPPSAKFITAATIDFQYTGPCALSPVVNATLVNLDVNTYIPLLSVNKVASLTNVIPGAALTYAINIPNDGSTNTFNSTLVDPIPAGVIYVTNTTTLNGISIPDINGTNMPFTVTREIHSPLRPAGQINVGETAVVTFQVTISSNPPARIFNSATIYMNSDLPTSSQSANSYVPPIYADLAAGITGVPNPVSAGAPINYTISVTNKGPNSINDATNFIMLSLPLPGSIVSPMFTPSIGAYDPLTGVWSGITLPSNGVITLTVSGQISPTASAGNIFSSVTATPPPGIIDVVATNNSASCTNAIVLVADMALTISDGVTNVAPGTPLTYTITTINLGPGTLTTITVSNFVSSFLTNIVFTPSQGTYNLVDGTWSGLNLAAGDGVTLTLQGTVRSNVVGAFTNSSIVFVPPGVTDPVPANNSGSDVDIALAPADVAIFKAGPATVFAGTNYSYTITVTNSGTGTASNVVASDVLPGNVTFVSASGNGINSSGVVTWNVGNLAANGRSNLTLTVTAPFSGNITNIAAATSVTPDPNPNNNTNPPVTTAVTPLANLIVGKSGPASVAALSSFNYTISITNLGPSSADGVVVTDAIPAGVTFVSASGGGVNNGGIVNWAVGTLNSGQVSNLTLTVTAPASGSLTNTALVSSGTLDTNSLNNTSPPVITIVTLLSADVRVAKIGPANVFAGTNFNYTITVTNVGPNSASNVVVSDVLPTNVVFVSASGGGALNAGTVNWPLGTLAVNAVTNLTLTVTAPISGTITNVATVTASTADPMPANNITPPVGTTVTPIANLAVSKAGPASIFVGANFNYTIAVTNLGPSPAASLSVTDSLPAGVVFVSASPVANINGNQVVWTNLNNLAAGAFTNLTLTVTTTLRGAMTNVATVDSPTLDNTPTNNISPPAITAVTNRPPVAVNNTASTAVNVPVTVPALSNDSDPDGDALTIISVSATNGTAIISGTNIVFTPTNNLTGTVGYRITDGFGGTNGALVTITVTNRMPVAVNDVGSTPRNTPINIPVLGNDSDPDGNPLTIVGVNPTNGVVVVGTNVIYTPPNVLGTNVITYTITDGAGGTNSALITINVTNRPPVAVNNTASTPVNVPVTVPVLSNDSDPDGDVLTIISVSATNGTAIISGTNIVFTPTNSLTGTVGYRIADGFGGTNTALVTISVTNRPPVAINDNGSTPRNVPVTIPVLNNDSDPDGNPLTIVGVSATNGTPVIVGTNVIYTPPNTIGTNIVIYTITDGSATNSALIVVAVTNRPPVASNDTGNGAKNVPITVPVLINDSDPDGDLLTIVSVSPTNGTAIISGTNVVFTPTTNLTGTVRYTITDGFGGTNFALVTINVTNRPPVVVNDGGSTSRGVPVTIPVLVNDSDPDGNPLTVIGVSATNGTPVVVGTNVVYTPPNVLGTNTIIYTVTDGGATNTALIIVTVTNRPPVAVNNTASTPVSVPVSVPVLGNDSDPDGDALTIISVSATNGTAIISGTNIVFTPTNSLTGTVGYRITDGFGGTNGALVTITVTNALTPSADIQVFLFGPTNVTVGDGFSYTITVTNGGPSTATNTLVQDILPTNLVFSSASAGGAISSNVITWPVFPRLANGESTNLIVIVTPGAFGSTNLTSGTSNAFNFVQTNSTSFFGFLTNIVSAFASTFDPNLTNNTGTLSAQAQVQTVIVPGVFSIFVATNTYPTNLSGLITNTIIPIGPNLFIVGTSAFNPQTGHYEESVTVTNLGTTAVHGLRLYVGGLRSGITMYNASGTNNGLPYVEYRPPFNSPLQPFPAANSSVTFLLEFFVADRRPFTNSLTVEAILSPSAAVTNGTAVFISQQFTDFRAANGRFVLEFDSIPGRTYTIFYGDSSTSITNIAVPSIVASANATQWYDDGPPKTLSKPFTPSTPTRFYRVLLNP